MWTKEAVEHFIKAHPVKTGGAIKQYKPHVRYDIDDGDIYHTVLFEWWTHNDAVVKDLIDILSALKLQLNVQIFLRDGVLRVDFYEHSCTPS